MRTCGAKIEVGNKTTLTQLIFIKENKLNNQIGHRSINSINRTKCVVFDNEN